MGVPFFLPNRIRDRVGRIWPNKWNCCRKWGSDHGGETGIHAPVGLVQWVDSIVRLCTNITSFSRLRVWKHLMGRSISVSSERSTTLRSPKTNQPKGRE